MITTQVVDASMHVSLFPKPRVSSKAYTSTEDENTWAAWA